VVSLVAKLVLKSVLTVEDLPTPETPIRPIVGGRASTSRRTASFTISSSFDSAAVWPFVDIAPTSLTGAQHRMLQVTDPRTEVRSPFLHRGECADDLGSSLKWFEGLEQAIYPLPGLRDWPAERARSG
jgi:hypothetical protein